MRLPRAFLLSTCLLAAAHGMAQSATSSALDNDLRQGTEAMRSGRFEEAEKWFKAAVDADPNVSAGHMELGVAKLRLGQSPEAIDELQKAISLDPTLQGAHLFLGIAYAQMHRLGECIAAVSREIELNPKNAQAYMWQGIAELQAGHPEKATTPLDRAVELAPDDLNILEYRGKAHSEVAFASYARMSVIAPDSWHVHRVQGQMYSQQNQRQEAIAEFLQAIKLMPNNSDLYEELGNEYRKTSQLELAQNAFSKELELSPRNPVATYNLAKIDIETNRTEEGLKLLRAVSTRYADAPGTYFYMGLGEFEAGNPKEALAALERARGMHPDPELMQRIQYELSRVYRKLGRSEESNRAIHEYTRLKAKNAKLDPAVSSAISNGFDTANMPSTNAGKD